MSNYIPTIGIEVHVELKTKTKIFSPSINGYGEMANSLTNVIDLGYPGTLPTLNKEVVNLAIKAATVLNCKIRREMHFDRKNYFYPDNPKNYQITQARTPIGYDGYVEINGTGMIGVGIGSGFGGPVHIERGKYIIRLVGQEGVGIGSYSGDVNPVIRACDMTIDLATARAIGIGSIMGNLHLYIEHITWMGEFNAEEAIGMGTFEGKECRVEFMHTNIMMNMHAAKICGVGANGGEVSLILNSSALIVTGEGDDAIGWGNLLNSAKVDMTACKMESKLISNLDCNIGVAEECITLDHAECHFIRDGEKVIIH